MTQNPTVPTPTGVSGLLRSFAHRLADGCQGGVDVARRGDVVEAGDDEVLGNAKPAAPDRREAADRHLVVAEDDRLRQCGPRVEQLLDRTRSPGFGEAAVHLGCRGGLETDGLECADKTGESLRRVG